MVIIGSGALLEGSCTLLLVGLSTLSGICRLVFGIATILVDNGALGLVLCGTAGLKLSLLLGLTEDPRQGGGQGGGQTELEKEVHDVLGGGLFRVGYEESDTSSRQLTL